MMSHVQFTFDPAAGRGTSRDLAEKLERVFGAARWVHNRGIIKQWEEIRAGRASPSLATLIRECIDDPSKEPGTEWLTLVPRGVLIDELNDLMGGWDDLKDIRSQRDLPLKKKKEDQEIIFPSGSFKCTLQPDHRLCIELEQTGRFFSAPAVVESAVNADAIKIERVDHDIYKATMYLK